MPHVAYLGATLCSSHFAHTPRDGLFLLHELRGIRCWVHPTETLPYSTVRVAGKANITSTWTWMNVRLAGFQLPTLPY